jgi:hypothetical protein
MKKLLKAFVVMVSMLSAFIIGLAVAGYLLEDRIVEYTISQLNNRLTATLKVKEVKASLIKNFPYASVTLSHVEIVEGSLETPKEFETGLISIDELTLKFNLISVFSKTYSIEKMLLKDGWINLYFDNSGKGNFDIFTKTEGSSKGWILDVHKLELDNINISYIDPRTGWVCKGYIEKGELNGQLNASSILVGTNLKGVIGILRQGGFHYLRNERLELKSTFEVTDSALVIQDGFSMLGGAKLAVDGTVGRGKGAPVSLFISGDNLSVNSLVLLLSQFNLSLPPNTKTKGDFTFKLSIDGLSRVDKPFLVNLKFFTGNLTLSLPEKPDLHLSNVIGNFSNGSQGKPESTSIEISQFRLETLNSYAEGALRLKNITSPLYHIKVKHSLDVGSLSSWGIKFPATSGEVSGDFEALGMLDQINGISLASFENSKFNAKIKVSNVSFEKVGRIPDIKQVSGVFTIAKQDITQAKLKGLLNGANFETDFSVTNAGGILFGNTEAIVQANVIVDSVNSSWLLADNLETAQVQGTSTWDRIQSISGDIFIDKFIHNDFMAQPLSASFYLNKNELVCNSFLCRSCDGIITGRIDASTILSHEYTLNADVDFDGIDVSKLFWSFNNFKQDIVTSQNLSGLLDGNVILTTKVRNGSISTNDAEATSRLTLSDGRLKNVKQLESLSKFIDLNELQDIYFSTLTNTITVRNEQVIIPQMEVSSSAINLFASGKHSFNGEYVYQTQLRLSDILFKKSSAQSNQFGVVEDDGDGVKVYLKIEGDKQNHNVSYDRATARDVFRDNLKKEGEVLKGIIQDEFSFLKKDSLNDMQQGNGQKADTTMEEKSTKFTIEWDDE